MDYHALAEKLVGLKTYTHLMPVARKLSALEGGTFLALNYLTMYPEAIHPKELSQKMAISSARVAALLNHMEREGLGRPFGRPGRWAENPCLADRCGTAVD